MTSDTVVQDEPLHFTSWAYTAVSDGRLTSQALARLLTLKSFYHAAATPAKEFGSRGTASQTAKRSLPSLAAEFCCLLM